MFKRLFCFLFFVFSFLFTTTTLVQKSSAAAMDSVAEAHAKADSNCISCHADDEPHDGIFGQDCSICHTPETWEQLGFDHGLSRFPLIGVHTEVDCDSCHDQAPGTTGLRSCRDCHLEDEPHDQRLSQNCARCHNPNGWEYWQFDHNQKTSFPLQGSHQDLECTACHTTPVTKGFHISKNCAACHRKDDQHRGKFGFNCERCHQPTEFKDVKIPY